MGNLVTTPSELELAEEQSSRDLPSMGKQFHTSLELVSKPIGIGAAVPEEPLWRRLTGNLRDAFFPRRLPQLELVSRPVPVSDPLAIKRDPVSSAISFAMHAAVFALILYFAFQAHKVLVAPKQVQITPVVIRPYIPVTVPAPAVMGGGGGGGAHTVVQANKGKLPPVAKTQVVPPELLVVDHPKLAVAPTVVAPPAVKLPMNNHMPVFGDTQSAQVALVSQGSGSGSGFGQGSGGGIGSGHGAGVGPGVGGGYGGGVMTVGGGVTAPRVLHSVEPDFTDAARNAKYQGIVSIRLIVDPQGNPQDIEVVRHLGMGLDEKAIEAVRQYKFRPAMFQGHPVPVQMIIAINFHLD